MLREGLDNSILGKIDDARNELWSEGKVPFKMRMSFATLYVLSNTLEQFRMPDLHSLKTKTLSYQELSIEPITDFDDGVIEMCWKLDAEEGKKVFEVDK